MATGFGDSPKTQRRGRTSVVTIAGSITILVAAVTAPLLGGFVDFAVNNQDLALTMLLREVSNLIATVAGVLVLFALAGLTRRPLHQLGVILLHATTAVVAFTIVRFVVQDYVNLLDLTQRPKWMGAEVLWALLLWPILVSIMALVGQREQHVLAQVVLLDEARRALQDDHEALRSRIFDHLHGTVTSELVVARVRLNDVATDTTDERLATRIRNVADNLQRLHELEVRRLAHVMVASGLDTSLNEALHQLAASCEGLCDVRVVISPEYTAIDRNLGDDQRAALRLTVYRIVEECISNALRHGQADHIDIDVAITRSGPVTTLQVTVASDGTLPADPVTPGVGHRVIRARVAAYNGGVETQNTGDRFVLRATLEVAP